MKLAKFMLSSLVILTISGGILAFKIRKDQFNYICYNETAPPISGVDTKTTCVFIYLVTGRTLVGGNRKIHYTVVDSYHKCVNEVTCPSIASTITLE